MEIKLKEWKVGKDEQGNHRIEGVYAVMSGKQEVAAQNFNAGYPNVSIPIPPELMVEANALTEKITTLIKESF